MASDVVTCQSQLDADATRIAKTVKAMLASQDRPSSIDDIVSNAVRIAYGKRVEELIVDAGGTLARDVVAGSQGVETW